MLSSDLAQRQSPSWNSVMSIRGPCGAGKEQDALAPVQSLTPACKGRVLVATVLGSSLTFIDGSALGVALPAIQWGARSAKTGGRMGSEA